MEITKLGNGKYKVRIWNKKLRQKIYVGTFSLRATAREAGMRAELELKSIGFIAERKDITLVDLCNKHVEMNRQLKETTLTWYENATRCALRYFGDSASVRRLSREDIQRYVAHLMASGKADKTVVGYIKALGAVLEQAVDWEYLDVNPARKIRNLPANKRAIDAIRILSPAEHACLVAAMPPAYRTMAQVWPFLGLRRSEMQGLRWDDVDLDEGSLRVRCQLREDGTLDPSLKTEKSRRTIKMPQNVIRELLHWKLASKPNVMNLVFPTERGLPQSSKPNFYKFWNQACREAGLAGCNPHDMRHTFATWSLAAGENPKRVADEMGHEKTSMMLDVYLHLLKDDDSDSTKPLEEWYYSQAAADEGLASTAPIPPLRVENG